MVADHKWYGRFAQVCVLSAVAVTRADAQFCRLAKLALTATTDTGLTGATSSTLRVLSTSEYAGAFQATESIRAGVRVVTGRATAPKLTQARAALSVLRTRGSQFIEVCVSVCERGQPRVTLGLNQLLVKAICDDLGVDSF